MPRIALEMALIKASFLSRFRDIGDILGKLSSGVPGSVAEMKDRPSFKTENVKEAEEINESRKLSPDTLDGKDMWSVVVRKLNEKNHLLACKLEHTEVELNGDTLSLVFNGGFSVHADSVKSQRKQIEDVATEVAARKIKVDIKTKKKVEKRADDVKEDVLNDPLVKEALELFAFPKLIGKDADGEEIFVATGRFGPYLRHKSKFYSRGNSPWKFSSNCSFFMEFLSFIFLMKKDPI